MLLIDQSQLVNPIVISDKDSINLNYSIIPMDIVEFIICTELTIEDQPGVSIYVKGTA